MKSLPLIQSIIAIGITILSFPILLFGQRNDTVSSDTLASVVSWARAHTTPLATVGPGAQYEVLAPFKDIVGHASVIALGEPAHGIHEFLTFRNRLFQFFVEKMGITAIAAETGYSESVAVDNYVLGRGELNDAVVGSVFSWSADVAYAENRALLEWMRHYNDKPSTRRKIHFYGLDLTGGRQGRFIPTHPAIDVALAYIATVDSVQATKLTQRLEPFLSRFTSAAHDSLTLTEQNSLTGAINDLVSLFERRQVAWQARTSAELYARAYHQAIIARQLDANFRAASIESNPQAQREAAMAQNLRWALDQEGAEGRIFLFEANWHVSKGPMLTDRWGSSLGEHLSSMFGKEYVSIASVCNRSEGLDRETNPSPAADPNSVAAMISQLGLSQCLLSLRDIPHNGPVKTWFGTLRGMQGGRVDNMMVSDAFNAVVFIGTVHPAH